MNDEGQTDISQDGRLVSEVLGGNIEKFDLIIARHQQRVFNCAYGITRNKEDAGDVTQETFIRFYRNLSQFDPERPLVPYLLKIAVNRAMTLLRRRVPEALSEVIELTVDSMESCHSEQLDRKDRSAFVRVLVGRLPTKLREVCTLYYLSECSCSQVAAILGMSENAVKVSLHRVRKKLVELWGEGGFCHV